MNKISKSWNCLLNSLMIEDKVPPQRTLKPTFKRRPKTKVYDIRAICTDWYFRNMTVAAIRAKHEKQGKQLSFAVLLATKTAQEFRAEFGIKEVPRKWGSPSLRSNHFVPAPGSKVGAGRTKLPPELRKHKS